MAGPIAKARNVSARIRRRQGSSILFRIALSMAFVVVCVVALPMIIRAYHSSDVPAAGGPEPAAAGQLAVSGLAPGACMSSAPTVTSAGKTVFIDPGHGGLDPGVVGMVDGKQVLEKDVTLAVATDLAPMLRGEGYRVVLARTEDSSVAAMSASDSTTGSLKASAVRRDLLTRAACANAADASVLVSIHFDAFGDPSVGGSETFYDTARAFAPESKRLAEDLQASLVASLGTSDRGVWTDDQLNAPTLTPSGAGYNHLIELGPALSGYVDDPSRMPGVLVEPLFLTRPQEARYANSDSGRQRIASALDAGLQKYFSGA